MRAIENGKKVIETGKKAGKKAKKKARSAWENFKRMIRLRLIVPMQRHSLVNPPEYTARGVMIGLGWAMTPLIGIQMYLCLMTWLVAKKVFKWRFSLIISCAWTWVTNFVTMIPTYYIFYITGQRLLGRHKSGEYEHFAQKIRTVFTEDMSTWEITKTLCNILFKDWGLAMLVGCIPYAILFSYLGYKLGYKYAVKRKERLLKKFQPNA